MNTNFLIQICLKKKIDLEVKKNKNYFIFIHENELHYDINVLNLNNKTANLIEIKLYEKFATR